MPIKKAPPPKKFDSSNTNVKTGKFKAPPPKRGASTRADKAVSEFHNRYAPVEQKQKLQPTATNTLREAITATQRRERDAGT